MKDSSAGDDTRPRAKRGGALGPWFLPLLAGKIPDRRYPRSGGSLVREAG